MKKQLSHIDNEGNPSMVDVGSKSVTKRRAIAQSTVKFPSEVLENIEHNELLTTKGPVFQTAILAGIMGAKRTSELIPLCHPLPLSKCGIDISIKDENHVIITCTVKTEGKTGVEMEALTGASIAALTVYDMCKALSHDIVISETKLMNKTGGKSDFERT